MKKLLTLLILFNTLLFSEVNSDIKISKEIMSKHIIDVIEHGWNDKNSTLNRELISNANHDMNETLLQLKTPITIDEKGYKTIVLKIYQYRQLLAYVKFLENSNRTEESNDIYLSILKSLKSIEAKSCIHGIFRLNLEDILMSSLKERLIHKPLNNELKLALKKTLLVDTKFLIAGIKSSESHTINLIKRQFLSDIRNDEHKKLIDLVLKYSIKDIKKTTNLQIDAIQNGSFLELNKHYKKKKKEIEVITSITLKKELAKIADSEERRKYLAKYISKTTSITTTSSSIDFYKKYLLQIENNKNFLQKLK